MLLEWGNLDQHRVDGSESYRAGSNGPRDVDTTTTVLRRELQWTWSGNGLRPRDARQHSAW